MVQRTCIDYWIHIDFDSRTARISVEGWDGRDQHLTLLLADGQRDGLQMAAVIAKIPKVAPPALA